MTYTLEDSPNFTDAEIATAVDASEADARKFILETKCSCNKVFHGVHQSLRRRSPYHYWVVQLWCKTCGNKTRRIFRLMEPDWRVHQ